MGFQKRWVCIIHAIHGEPMATLNFPIPTRSCGFQYTSPTDMEFHYGCNPTIPTTYPENTKSSVKFNHQLEPPPKPGLSESPETWYPFLPFFDPFSSCLGSLVAEVIAFQTQTMHRCFMEANTSKLHKNSIIFMPDDAPNIRAIS